MFSYVFRQIPHKDYYKHYISLMNMLRSSVNNATVISDRVHSRKSIEDIGSRVSWILTKLE